MAASRLFARRTIVLIIVVCAFMSVLMLTSKQLGQLCDGGSYCDISGLREKLPKFGNDGTNGHNTNANDKSRKGGQHVEHDSESSTLDDECALFPNTSSVQLIMKTGASESYSKIPTQLMTNLKCVPDFLFFSDMAQKIAGYTIHDSLDTVLDEVKEKNKDFELYHRQKKCPIDQEQCNKNHDVAKQGWDLDKYKNIHMAEKAYKLRPNADWYLFVDADTYVVFPTLMEWLKALDPNKPHYIGSVAYLGGFPFGHGGSGYLVSKAAMHAMFYGKTGVANKYDEPVQHTCCGDYMWSKALKDETGIEVVNAWPVINGEKPHTLPYAEDEWCQPIVTMHHAAAEDISDIYAFEKERKFQKMLRIKDLYHKFMGPELVEARPDWDNLSEDVYYLNKTRAAYEDWELGRAKNDDLSAEEAEAYKSFDDCKKACLSMDNCFQFRYQNSICAVAHKFMHGKPVKKGDDDSKRYMSGWNVKKIKEWIEEQADCDKKQFKWPVKDR
ncbi:glycosyltransferase family 31 protein [Pochonia chlamydosporia 170]|uniref:N-acetylgalactosaminide beta-1,3-galactosyltransferase n=1 Tax=Pochonia chlamydosporia 170 TaxID=1380566 RepID=A0A179G766_METCM|nr:glycosyltransferase family 31 protein [Pochonia chlamydosporia 170]OAQ73253.1 glycosyltransferase family 31 protein [Pochonia chlamydosporia 170]